MLKIIAIGVLLIVLVIAFYLYIQNRSLPDLNSKVVPVLFLGCIGTALTIWYSLRSERIDQHFASTVYFHKSDLLLLDEHDARRHLYGGDQFRIPLQNYIKRRRL